MDKKEREKEFLERITDKVICYNSYGESAETHLVTNDEYSPEPISPSSKNITIKSKIENAWAFM